MLKKQSILQIKGVYTAHAFPSGSRFYIGAGSETEPVVQLHDLAAGTTELLEGCPGGMMSFLPFPGRSDAMVSIMGLFPPFLGTKAGLYFHRKTEHGWKTRRALELPFAHRCEFLPGSEFPILIAATVSRHKENPADWSMPGEVYAIQMDQDLNREWNSSLIDASVTRNHGMVKARINGMQRLCVSGQEGILAIGLSENGSWNLEQLFKKEVSEMTFIDLDGDGSSELVTIEPFHGDTLNIYKNDGERWNLKYSASLSFGHGLSSGLFHGLPLIVAGNRRGSFDLEIFTVGNLEKGIVNRQVIEKDAGPTQTQVFTFQNSDYILSANQKKNEVALYSGEVTD
jgi:hypothetical protein